MWMDRLSPTKKKVLCVLAAISAVFGLIVTPFLQPGMMSGVVYDKLTIDTQAKFDELEWGRRGGQLYTSVRTRCFFNVTNAYELQTVTPAPTPALTEICIPMTVKVQSTDFELSGDETEYYFKTWSYEEPTDVGDLDVSFIGINAPLLITMAMFGSEQAIAYIQPAMYAALQMDAAYLKSDGTGAMNVGLFARRTLREILYGYNDPMLGPIPGQTIESAYATFEAFQEALANGTLDGASVSFGSKTGKHNRTEMGQMAFVNGLRNRSATTSPDVAGWDASGNTSADREAFVLDGLYDMASMFLMPPLPKWPTLFERGADLFGVQPSLGTHLDAFDYYLARKVRWICEGDCSGETVNGVHAQKFVVDESVGALTVNGVPDESCATIGTCDFGMRFPFIWDMSSAGMPLFFSLPYFGKAPSYLRQSFSITKEGSADEEYYDEAGMRDELFMEPFTGTKIKNSVGYLQFNYLLSPDTLNGALYANVFSGNNSAPDFIWPSATIKDIYDQELLPPWYLIYKLMLANLIISFLVGVLNLYTVVYLARSLLLGSDRRKGSHPNGVKI